MSKHSSEPSSLPRYPPINPYQGVDNEAKQQAKLDLAEKNIDPAESRLRQAEEKLQKAMNKIIEAEDNARRAWRDLKEVEDIAQDNARRAWHDLKEVEKMLENAKAEDAEVYRRIKATALLSVEFAQNGVTAAQNGVTAAQNDVTVAREFVVAVRESAVVAQKALNAVAKSEDIYAKQAFTYLRNAIYDHSNHVPSYSAVWKNITSIERSPSTNPSWLPKNEEIMNENINAFINNFKIDKGASEDSVLHPHFLQLLNFSYQYYNSLSVSKENVKKRLKACRVDIENKKLKVLKISRNLQNLEVIHCIYTQVLEGLSPDFIAFDTGIKTGEALGAVMMMELAKELDNAHLGKAVVYNKILLHSQPNRLQVVTAVTDMKHIVFVRSCREGEAEKVEYTAKLPLRIGWMYLCTFLFSAEDITGYKIPAVFSQDIHIKLSSYLGSGATAHVYAGASEIDKTLKAVKLFKDADEYKQEKDRLRWLLERTSFDLLVPFCKLESFDDSCRALIMSPVGKSIRKADALTLDEVDGILFCLKKLKEYEVVHRDITPRHFLTSDGKLFLIDFGFAVECNKNHKEEIQFSGSSHYAAAEILEKISLDADAKYVPHFKHDMESAMKSLIMRSSPDLRVELNKIQNSEIAKINGFWETVENKIPAASPWKQALVESRKENGDIEKIKELMKLVVLVDRRRPT